ncbi:general stress protein [Paenibacillus tarimensis]|uniref:general stress protein n=1 Tax=Paenibacillus tarimensis TaxID=416012 RepID=UPI001F18E3E1|nr:general stress protein [Paenibacillus tarimensis]MCF2943642.1 general stress protein [Paenibacillus tarimensis]
MAKTIGIFARQEQVIEAIQGLERAGYKPEEIKVLAKDHDGSRLVESETDVHVDELNDLTDARGGRNDGIGGILPAGAAPAAAAGGGGGYTGGTGYASYNGAAYPAGVLAFGSFANDDGGMKSALEDLGLDSKEAKVCRDAIRDGKFAVVAETDNSYGTNTDSVFRNHGASEVL